MTSLNRGAYLFVVQEKENSGDGYACMIASLIFVVIK